jgi:hypothetical protein
MNLEKQVEAVVGDLAKTVQALQGDQHQVVDLCQKKS